MTSNGNNADTRFELPDMDLPPLPPIANAHLALVSVTHSSARMMITAHGDGDGDGDRNGREFEDFEKLAHIGDSLIGAAVTLVMHKKLPQLNKGSATVLKAHVVNNDTLADLAHKYGLHTQLIASAAQMRTLPTQTKCLSAMFEARVAVVFFDYLTSDIPGAYATPREGHALPRLPPCGQRTDGAACDYLSEWLTPLFEPIIADFRFQMIVNGMVDTNAEFDDEDAEGATMFLNQFVIQRTTQPPAYEYSPVGAKWCCVCEATVGGTTYTAEAVRMTKKAAQTIAAYLVYQKMGLHPDVHMGKKRRVRLLPTQ